MQCTNYLPGYFYPRDNVVNITGNSRSISHSDITCNSSNGFRLAFPLLMVDESQDLVYQKEILRQTILNHEATFRYQVNELHRLYGRQRELMNEMKKRELVDDQIHLQASEANTFMSLFRSEVSEKAFRRSVNLRSIEPYAPSKEMFQEPLISGADKTVQSGGDCFSGLNILNECKASSSKNNTTRKRMLDLELPAEKTIDNEARETFQEENPAKKTNTLISELRPQCSSKVNFVASGDSSSSPSSCRGTFLLFDLNEPVQPFESECPNSAFESNNIHKEIRDKDLDLPGMARAECSTLNKEVTGRDESNLKSFEEDCSVGRGLLPWNQPASLPLENGGKVDAETRTDKSLLISSWSEFKQIPVAVQALSCVINNASFCKSTESSVGNSSLTVKKFNMNLGPPSTSTSGSLTSCFMQHDVSDSTGEQIAAVKDEKFSDYTSSENGMDLNLTPSIRLSHCQSAPSKISHLNFPEGRNVEMHKKSEVPDSNMVLDSTAEYRKCTRDSHLVGSRIDSKLSTANICIDLNSCIKEDLLSSSPSEATKSTAERDLEGPVSPENKECSPPRGDSQDINSRTSVHLPRRGHDDPVEELDAVAADILTFISSSMVYRYSKTAIGEPSETSSNCLRRLAEVAISLASSQENEDEQPVAKKKVKGIVCNQPRRRTKNQKDLQTDVLPAVESLLHQVNETNIASKSGPSKKTPSRTSSRGRRWSNDGERTLCSILLQHTLDNKHGITGRFLKGWGVTKKRQRARRAQPYVSPLFLSTE